MDSTVNQMYIVKQVLIELKKLKLKTVDKSNIHMITVCLVKEKEFQSVNLTVVAKVQLLNVMLVKDLKKLLKMVNASRVVHKMVMM